LALPDLQEHLLLLDSFAEKQTGEHASQEDALQVHFWMSRASSTGLAKIPEASIPVSIVEAFFRYRRESIVSIPESILTPKINSFFYYYIIPLISSLSIKRNTYYY
jgi:hypothetical protein